MNIITENLTGILHCNLKFKQRSMYSKLQTTYTSLSYLNDEYNVTNFIQHAMCCGVYKMWNVL